MSTAIFAFAAMQITDWGPLKAAAERYAICAFEQAAPQMKSKVAVPLLVDTSIRACSKEERVLRAETRLVYRPLVPSKAALEESVEEQASKQRTLLRNNLIAYIKQQRR